MVVPFNLYSLGYFLKQFIEHYPKLNCIYYPLTQLLKWFHIHLILIVCSLAICVLSDFTINCKRDCLVLVLLPSQTILCLGSVTHGGSCSDLKNLSSSV